MPTKARRKKQPFWEQEVVRFLLICFTCFITFAIAYLFIRESGVLSPFLAFNATLASGIVNAMGASTTVVGSVIEADSYSFQVIEECTSLIPTGVLVSVILAWPCNYKKKLMGICLGALAFFVINMGRIVSLFYVAKASPGLLDLIHFFVWGPLTVLIIVGLWFLWAKTIVRNPLGKGLAR
jgi:exosortase/archaeosortase family protein